MRPLPLLVPSAEGEIDNSSHFAASESKEGDCSKLAAEEMQFEKPAAKCVYTTSMVLPNLAPKPSAASLLPSKVAAPGALGVVKDGEQHDKDSKRDGTQSTRHSPEIPPNLDTKAPAKWGREEGKIRTSNVTIQINNDHTLKRIFKAPGVQIDSDIISVMEEPKAEDYPATFVKSKRTFSQWCSKYFCAGQIKTVDTTDRGPPPAGSSWFYTKFIWNRPQIVTILVPFTVVIASWIGFMVSQVLTDFS